MLKIIPVVFWATILLFCAERISARSSRDLVVAVERAKSEQTYHTSEPEVCMNEHCIAASHRLFQSMNLSADPCQDFDEFACGRFKDEFIMPEDKTRWSSFTPASESVYERGRQILEDEPAADEDWPIFDKVREFYQSCMDEEKLEELGVEPLMQKLEEFGGWPALLGDKWNKDQKDYLWYEKIYQMSQAGFGKDYIFEVSVGTDDRNSSYRAIFLDQPNLGLSREYLIKGFDDPDVQHYYQYMKDALKLLGGDPDKVEEELEETLRFELTLAELSAPREERRNASKLYNPFILGDYPSLAGHPPSWTDYVNNVLYTVEITDEERIIVQNPEYVKKVAPVLEKTSPRTIANYIGWRITKSVLSYLNQDARDVNQKFKKAILGQASESPRWKTCVSATGFNSFSDASFRIPSATLYVKRYFPPEAKEAMESMIEYIRNAFDGILDELDWMDEETKKNAKTKLTKMAQHIAYPDELLNQEIIEKHLEGIGEMDVKDYLGNTLKLIKWNRDYKYGRLREKVDKKHWTDHSLVAVVNAFYDPSKNSIEFPAGILQGVFFNKDVPKALNFGAIGGVIGHEITHGFDDSGRQYDEEGNLRNWWNEETLEKFVNRTKCIINQYASYKDEQVGLNLNGINTQGENIADHGGTKEGYRAYVQYLKENGGREAILPGHDFTPKQLFWISWGQVWCSLYRDGALKRQILTGYHSPGRYRINGPLSNSPEFARDFNCPADSPMSRPEKCEVW